MPATSLKTLVLIMLMAVVTAPASAQTVAALDVADPKIGDHRHKLDLVHGQARIALSCRTTRPNVHAAAVMFSPDRNWPREPIAIELTRGNGPAHRLVFNGNLNLLLSEGSAARELVAWGLSDGTLTLRVDDAVASFDLARPQVASALARFKKLCHF